MSNEDYYKLQQEVYKLREKFALAEFQKRMKPIKTTLIRLTTMQNGFSGGVCEMKEIVDDFNNNKLDIDQKLQNSNYIHMDRTAATHFKSITQHAVHILANTSKRTFDITNPEETVKNDLKTNQNFIRRATDSLRRHEEHYKYTKRFLLGVAQLCNNQIQYPSSLDTHRNAEIMEYEYRMSSNSDCTINSTINTIISENVAASSPIL